MNQQKERLILAADQKNLRVSLYSLEDMDWSLPEAVRWYFTPGEEHRSCFSNVSGMKFRNFSGTGPVVLICCSGGFAGMVSYPSGELLWSTAANGNLHSIELLENGDIALAASTGGWVRVYSAASGWKEYGEIASVGAHGALWDPEGKLLWGTDHRALRAYRVGSGLRPSLEEVITVPFSGRGHGHMLAAVPGEGRFWVTTSFDGVLQYDRQAGTFVDYPGAVGINRNAVKGLASFTEPLSAAVTIPNKTWKLWDTDRVLVLEGPDLTLESERVAPESAFYKVAAFRAEYI